MPDSHDHIGTAVASPMSDEVLFESFLDGDDRSYTKLYERYDGKILTYQRTILRDHPEAADDMFQEAFLRLFRERKRHREEGANYKPIQSVRSWLFRVAHNLAISYLRQRKKTITFSETGEGDHVWDERLMAPVEESFAELYGESDPLQDEELYGKLLACVEMLPMSLREIYVLKEVNNLPYEEVTRITGVTYEAARMRLSRARKTLRKALSQYLRQE
ncbi:MAG: sigma-70 family RNA polymerase sigma factor [Chlorobi bacterium]|nr:sigma-70 family RNA polymerase sigma factor [Chlorobiota bacterium]